MHRSPPDRTDLTDLITDDNQASQPTPETSSKSPMAQLHEAAEREREREKKGKAVPYIPGLDTEGQTD